MAVNQEALRRLKSLRDILTAQEFKTLKGQILAGDDAGAAKGLLRIVKRKREDRHRETSTQ